MKFLDLFAGIGGFRLGLEQAGHTCVGFCEIDKFARASYKAIHHTKGELEYHDIREVTDEQWRQLKGTVDIICGGFPCQAFSIAGKRKGFLDETRGTLFFEIARAVKQIKPQTLFLENVKGLLSHEGGRTFRVILSTLDELGYDAEWQVLNSKDFSVPQNRERVFIIGHLRGGGGREVFPLRTYAKENSTSRVLASTLTTRYPAAQREGTYIGENGQNQDINQSIKIYGTLPSARAQSGRIYNENGLAPTLSTMQGGDQTPKIAQIIQKGRGYNKGNTHELAPTVSSHSYHENNFLKESVLPVLTPDRVNKRQNGRRFKKEDEPMFTLTSQDRHGVAMIRGLYTNDSERYYRGSLPEMARTLKANKSDAGVTNGVRVRKLTPLECWRLQGFPDWAFYKAQEVNSNSQLYKQAGNSVTVSVIYAIACQL